MGTGKGYAYRFRLAQRGSAACGTVLVGRPVGDHKLQKVGLGHWCDSSGYRVDHTGINLEGGGSRSVPSVGEMPLGRVHN